MATTATLNPLATYDPVASLNQKTFYGRIWKIAQLISYIAFPALGIFAGTFTLILWPVHLKLVVILNSLLGSFGLYKLGVVSLSKINFYRLSRCRDKGIKKIAKELAEKNLNHILEKELGFSSTASDSVKKNLLACYFFHEKAAERLKKKRQSIKRQQKMSWSLSLAAESRLRAAYYLYLIQKPDDLRKFEDFVGLTFKVQPIANAAGRAFSRDQILSTSAPKLSSQIFGLQRNRSFFLI